MICVEPGCDKIGRNRGHGKRGRECEKHHRLRYGMKKSPAQRRRSRLKHYYQLTPIEWDQILFKQGMACAVCGDKTTMDLAVDHDHKTGAIRGLLCRNCNAGIGLLKDDPSTLRRAAAYIERAKNASQAG